MERHKIEPHKKIIFTKHLFIDLAKECGLNAAIFEQLGSGRDTEIVVDNDTLEMLVKLQEQFARLEEMGDDEYRGFYIELPALLRKNGEIAKRRLQIENMRARKNTSGLEIVKSQINGMVSCQLRQVQRKSHHTIHG